MGTHESQGGASMADAVMALRVGGFETVATGEPNVWNVHDRYGRFVFRAIGPEFQLLRALNGDPPKPSPYGG